MKTLRHLIEKHGPGAAALLLDQAPQVPQLRAHGARVRQLVAQLQLRAQHLAELRAHTLRLAPATHHVGATGQGGEWMVIYNT